MVTGDPGPCPATPPADVPRAVCKGPRRGRHEAEHLRRFLDARARGDAAAMRRGWEELVIDLFDRVDGLVYAAHRGRLDEREHEDAVALSLARISERLIHTFQGASMGELVNATADARARDLHRRPAGVGAPSPPRGRVARRRLGGRPGGPPGAGLGGGRGDAALRGRGAAAPTRRPSSTGRSPSSRSAAAPWSS